MSALDLILNGNPAGAVGALGAAITKVDGLVNAAAVAAPKLAPLETALTKAAGSIASGVQSALDKSHAAFASFAGKVSSLAALAGKGTALAMGGLAAGSAAVIGAGIGAVKVTSDWAGTLDDLGDVLGTNARESAALAVAWQSVGGDVGQLAGQMTFFARGLSNAKGELGPVGQELADLGVNVMDTSGDLLPVPAILERVAKALSKYPDDINKAALMTRIFGRSGRDLQDVMSNLASGGLAAAERKAKDFGLLLSDDTVNASVEGQRAFASLQLALQGFATQVGTSILPYIAPAIKSLGEWLLKLSQAFNVVWVAFTARLEPMIARFTQLIGKGNLSGAVAEFVAGLLDMAGVSRNIGALIGNTLGNVAGGISKALNQLLKGDITGAWQILIGGFREAFRTGLGPLIAMAGDWLRDSIPGLKAAGGDWIAAALNWLKEQWPQWVKGLGDWANSAANWLADSFPGFAAQAGDYTGRLLAWLLEVADAARPELLKLADQFIDWVNTSVMPRLPGVLEGIAKGLALFLINLYIQLQPSIDRLSAQFLDWVAKDVLPKLPGVLARIGIEIAAAIGRLEYEALKGAAGIGAAIIDGIADGIERNIQNAIGNVERAIDRLLQAARNAGIIRSPSKLFAEKVGKPLAQGIALGLNEPMRPRDFMPVLSMAGQGARQALAGAGAVTVNVNATVRNDGDINSLARAIAREIQRAR